MIGARVGIYSGKGVPFTFGNCLLFDGVNDDVQFTAIASLTDFTVSFWVYLTAVDNNVVLYNSSNAFQYIQINAQATQTLVNCSFASGAITQLSVISTGIINTWACISITRNSGIVSGQLNGAAMGVVTNHSNSLTLNRIGNYGSGFSFSGKIDNLGIWNTGSTSGEMTAMYGGGSGAYLNVVKPAGLQLYYKFDETSGTSASDSSGNLRTGTLVNFTGTFWVAH